MRNLFAILVLLLGVPAMGHDPLPPAEPLPKCSDNDNDHCWTLPKFVRPDLTRHNEYEFDVANEDGDPATGRTDGTMDGLLVFCEKAPNYPKPGLGMEFRSCIVLGHEGLNDNGFVSEYFPGLEDPIPRGQQSVDLQNQSWKETIRHVDLLRSRVIVNTSSEKVLPIRVYGTFTIQRVVVAYDGSGRIVAITPTTPIVRHDTDSAEQEVPLDR